MKVLEVLKLNEMFRRTLPSDNVQIYGNMETAWHVQDIIKATRNIPPQKIPLTSVLGKGPDYKLDGTSDEEDHTPEFRNRTRGLSLRDFINGDYEPVIIEKNDKGGFDVVDGRHRVLNFLSLLLRTGKRPENYSIIAKIMDKDAIKNKIATIAQKNDAMGG